MTKTPKTSAATGASDPRRANRGQATEASPFRRTAQESSTVRETLQAISRNNPKRSKFIAAIDTHLARLGKAFWPFQVNALRNLDQAQTRRILTAEIAGQERLGRDVKSSLIVSPTDSGKTSILAPEILDSVREGKKVLVLGHRDYLLTQIKDRIIESCPTANQADLTKDKIQICQGGKALKEANKDKPITIASTQTLMSNRDKLPNFFKDLDLIVIDESHHYSSQEYLTTLESIINKIPGKKDLRIIGATATPLRHTPGVVPLSDIFPLENIVWTRTMRQLIADGRLKAPSGIRLNTNLGEDLSVDVETQNVNSDDIKQLTRKDEFNNLLFEAYEDNSPGKNVIFYSHDLEHSELLFQKAIERGHQVAMIDGEKVVFYDSTTSERIVVNGKTARDEVFRRFGDDIKVIINCKVLTEALDLPQTEAIVFGSVTRSIPELQQIVGRGMRIDPNNPNNTRFDFIYLDPKTKDKFGFANLATLGLEEFETISPGGGRDVEGHTPRPMAEELDATELIHEGDLIEKPNAAWYKLLKTALKNKYPELNFEEAVLRLTETMTLQTTSALNLRDLVVGSDILFGAHGCTKIREAQRIFRAMIDFLGIDYNRMQCCFPRLVGFRNSEELSKFLRSVYIERPDIDKAFRVLDELYGIDRNLVTSLFNHGQTEPKELSEIFDGIWNKQNWNKTYESINSYFTLNPAEKKLSRALLLKEFNDFLNTKIQKNPPQLNLVDLESVRNFQSFLYRNNLDSRFKAADLKQIEGTFIPRLEKAIWIDENKRLMSENNLPDDKTEKLKAIGISAPAKANTKSTQAEVAERLKKANELFKTYGSFSDYPTNIATQLGALLYEQPIEDLERLKLPKELNTTESITTTTTRIAQNHRELIGVMSEITQALTEHLEIAKWIMGLKSQENVINPKTDADKKLSKFIKRVTS